MRLFVALAIPDSVAQGLFLIQAGIPGARWQTREQLHLTLRFIGEVDGREASDIDEALAAISPPRFKLALKGVGEFGGKKPHAVWAGVSDRQAVDHLNRKVETALQRIGIAADEQIHAACDTGAAPCCAFGQGDGLAHRPRALCQPAFRGFFLRALLQHADAQRKRLRA